MANEIYITTRDGLEGLVSHQVADRVLARALAAARSDPDTVDAALMSRLLRGRVRRELERSLPAHAVRRSLSQLDARLDARHEKRPAARREAVGAEMVAPQTHSALQGAERRSPRALPAAILERISGAEAVRQWIWAAADGSVKGRGAGPDPVRAFRLFAPLATVLERSGAVRSIHVHHGSGHVLFGRHRGSTLAVAGDDDLNLGAIYATFRALEEEP